MLLSKYSCHLVLDLIEDRINQLDPLVPQDARDLEALIRCREEMKVSAHAAGGPIREPRIEADWPAQRKADRQPDAAMSLSLDVI